GRGVRLTVEVGVADSDGLLRTLLTADPPWHIRAVTAIDDNDPQEPARGAKEKA
ncbi:ABC transporter ATP-binding protein, partial [Streptomyces javensis]|nr:ABC transporter ATP-binding protein [Streptomyces javensis]